jgi:hypothetical protein
MKVSRRIFLNSACVAAIVVFREPAQAVLGGAFATIPTEPFLGNPNTTISAIQTSPAISVTGKTTSAAFTFFQVTNLSTTAGLLPGMLITGPNVPGNTVISNVDHVNSIVTLSQACTGTGSDVTFTCGGNPIHISRLTGQTPAFFQVSASGVLCTGTRTIAGGVVPAVPYEDLEYVWDFGDPASLETFLRPTDGVTVNANNEQIGPEAAHCYRNAGTYTITLRVRGKNGSGYTTATFIQQVVVSAFAATAGSEFWVDSIHGSDSNNGRSSATPKQTLSFLRIGAGGTIPNWPGSPTRSGSVAIHLAQGSSWTGSGLKVPNSNVSLGPASNLRIDSFVGLGGPGSPPVITTNDATSALDAGSPSGNLRTKQNIVISGITLTNTSGASAPQIFNVQLGTAGFGSFTMTDIYLDNCTVQNTQGISWFTNALINGSGDAGSSFTNMGFWKCNLTATAFNLTGVKHSFFGGPSNWLMFFGCSLSGNGSSSTLDHHIYTEVKRHGLFKWNTFGQTGTGSQQRNYCVNINVNWTPGVEPPHECFGGEAQFTGTISAGVMTVSGMLAGSPNIVNRAMLSGPFTSGVKITSFGTGTGTTGTYNISNGALSVSGATTIGAINPGTGAIQYGEFFLFSENVMGTNTGTSCLRAHDLGDQRNDPRYVQFRNIVTERNALANLTGSDLFPYAGGISHTLRGNRSWGCDGGVWFQPAGGCTSPLALSFYQNLVYRNAPSGSVVALINGSSGKGISISNGSTFFNCPRSIYVPQDAQVVLDGTVPPPFVAGRVYFYNIVNNDWFTLSATKGGVAITADANGANLTISAIWATPGSVTDNILWTANAASTLVTLHFAQVPSKGILVDRNSYYSSNIRNYLLDNLTAKSFTQWQTQLLDVNGTQLGARPAGWAAKPGQWSDFGP